MRIARWVPVLLIASVALSSSVAHAQISYVSHDHVVYRPFQLGVSAIAGAQIHTQARGTDVDGVMRFGVDLLGTITPGFAIGVTRVGVGYSPIDGALFSIGATPTLELSFFATAHAQLLLQAGATIAVNTSTLSQPLGVNVAATAVLGIRWWLGNLLSLGLLVGADVGLTNPGIRRWFGGPLMQGEPTVFIGLELGFHL
jgi:hypothetical protein